MDILPRFIRHKNAPAYLGVDRNKFDAEVRPFLTSIPLGKRSLAFDRHELDAWADEYKRLHGKPGWRIRDRILEDEPVHPAAQATRRALRDAAAPPPELPARKVKENSPRRTMGTPEERSAALLAQLAEMRRRPKR